MDHHKWKCTRHQKWSNLKCVAYTAANLQALLVRLKLDVTLCILMCLFYNKQFMSWDSREYFFCWQGTQLYDAKRGSFVDLGILDVMQIFGRAGRPQFDTFGHGTIITTHDKLSHYLSLMTRQNPIESQFINSLTDNLNAEVMIGWWGDGGFGGWKESGLVWLGRTP